MLHLREINETILLIPPRKLVLISYPPNPQSHADEVELSKKKIIILTGTEHNTIMCQFVFLFCPENIIKH